MSEVKHLHPGTLLSSALDERGISTKEFAETLGIAESSLVSVLEGKSDIGLSFSAAINRGLGESSALRWRQLQEDHDKWKQSKLSQPHGNPAFGVVSYSSKHSAR